MINRVQGFISQTASLVDTEPTVDADVALNLLKEHWNHSLQSTSLLQFRDDPAELQILQGVRSNVPVH